MPYHHQRHHRRSIRLRGYDYRAEGAYFVTIVAQDRACPFGQVVNADMELNEYGEIAEECWRNIPAHFPNVELDEFIIMPSHVHGILAIKNNDATDVGATHASPLPHALPLHASPLRASPLPESPHGTQPASVGAVVGSYKSAVTKRFNARCGTPGAAVCATTMNTSSATTNPSAVSGNTSSTTRRAGPLIEKTRRL
jgi:putative transposase